MLCYCVVADGIGNWKALALARIPALLVVGPGGAERTHADYGAPLTRTKKRMMLSCKCTIRSVVVVFALCPGSLLSYYTP